MAGKAVHWGAPVKIDFVRTERELARFIQNRLALLSSKHPKVVIKRVGLWALSIQKVATLLVETDDDDAVLGNPARYEYVPNEYGLTWFDWWPDLYELKEGDRYEIPLEEEWEIDTQLLVGDNAINLPLFALIKKVLEAVSLEGLNLSSDFQLTAEIGCHFFQSRLKPGETLKTGPLIRHLVAEFRAGEAGLRPKIPTTHEAFKHRLVAIQAGTVLSFDSAGEHLICFGNRKLEILDVRSGTPGHTIDCGGSELHHRLAVSRDLKLGAAYGGADSIRLLKLDTGHVEAEWTTCGGIQSAALSPNGEQLAAATSDSAIQLWDVSSGKLRVLASRLRTLWHVTFSPDGRLLAW